jgi:NADH dehydrogenase FAD-containing subunit
MIVGCGFAGLEAARRLTGTRVRLTLIDRTSEFVFRPLLCQLLSGRVGLSTVAHPFAEVVRSIPGASFRPGILEEIESRARRVVISGQPVGYDYLLLCTGAARRPMPKIEEALTLESLADCRRLDRAIVDAAAGVHSRGSRRSSSTFVIVGGGPLGVELAAAIRTRLSTIARHASLIRREGFRVVLVHQGQRLLENYPEAAGRYAARTLSKLGVEVILNERVTGSDAALLREGNARCNQILIWAGGRYAPPLAEIPGLGNATLEPDLSVRGHPEILILGDLAGSNRAPTIPALASAAMQMGQHAARIVRSDLSRRTRSPFCYADHGYGTYIGPQDAIVVLGGHALTGATAFAAKMALHLAHSTASTTPSQEMARKGVEALRRRILSPRSRGLSGLERTPPYSEGKTKVMHLETRVADRQPSHVFDVAVARLEELFANIQARVLERSMTAEGYVRMSMHLGDWPVLRWPIEVAFDRTRHAMVITTLATHPLRARAIIKLRADGADTMISQTNRYELGLGWALSVRALGLEERITSFWQRFHDALREAASHRGAASGS